MRQNLATKICRPGQGSCLSRPSTTTGEVVLVCINRKKGEWNRGFFNRNIRCWKPGSSFDKGCHNWWSQRKHDAQELTLERKVFLAVSLFYFLSHIPESGGKSPLPCNSGQVTCKQTHHLYFARFREEGESSWGCRAEGKTSEPYTPPFILVTSHHPWYREYEPLNPRPATARTVSLLCTLVTSFPCLLVPKKQTKWK